VQPIVTRHVMAAPRRALNVGCSAQGSVDNLHQPDQRSERPLARVWGYDESARSAYRRRCDGASRDGKCARRRVSWWGVGNGTATPQSQLLEELTGALERGYHIHPILVI
jgi:hypothetical protein